MKITVNNLKVPSEVNSVECKIKSSTLIFKPSEIGQYKGSVYKQRGTGIGISKSDGTVNVISKETDITKNINWCLINFNGYYYYTPADYIDLSSFKDPNPIPVSLDKTKEVKTTSATTLRTSSKLRTATRSSSSSSDDAPYVEDYIYENINKLYSNLSLSSSNPKLPNGKYIYQRKTLLNNYGDTAIGYVDDKQFSTIKSGLSVNAGIVYEYPSVFANTVNDSEILSMLNSSRVFPIQSIWIDNLSGKNNLFYGTTFFSSGGGFKTRYIRENYCNFYNKASQKYNQYYSMCHSANSIAGIQLGNGQNPGNFTHHDTMTAHFPVDGVGYDCDLYQITRFAYGSNYQMAAIKPVAYNEFSPNAHSSDWLNANYLGMIQNKESSADCKKIPIGKFFSQTPKDTHRFKMADISYWLSSQTTNTLSSTTYKPLKDNLDAAGPKLITYNRVSYNGKNYYIASQSGYRDSWFFVEDDGSLNWIALPNGYSEVSVPAVVTTPQVYEGITYADLQTTVNSLSYSTGGSTTGNPATEKEASDSKKSKTKDEPWYDITLDGGDKSWSVPGIIEGVDETFINTTEQWADALYTLASAEIYEGKEPWPVNGINKQHQLNRINRFRLLPTDSGLSTKSFIFMTRPDLNLFDRDAAGNIIDGQMNPDLKRLPTFKYIARLRQIGAIMSMLEVSSSSVASNNRTPWLSIISNQATGYQPIERRMDTTEIGETFHGNKIIYAEPTFTHKIAGTITIPFRERRDLSLYYTLKMWIEYIQAVTLGRASPRREYIKDMILDYATSIYFIQTDETMENILYWEKLVGVIPLVVPDNFFEWDEKSPGKNMEYSIDFAYSMRVVQDEMSLFEINNLYSFSDTRRDGGLVHYDAYSLSHNSDYDDLITRVADSFGTFDNDKTGYPYKFEQTNDSYRANWAANAESMKRFYYANKPQFAVNQNPVTNGYKVQATAADGTVGYTEMPFLPNYLPDLGMHGTPYVTGPFITKELDRTDTSTYTASGQVAGTPVDNGMYKLRWV